MRRAGLYLLVIFSLACISCSGQRIKRTAIEYKQVKGVKAKKLSLDIYNAETSKLKPVVVFVHGGAWLLGDKRTKIKKKVKLFNEMGYVFVSVNYRLSSFFNKKTQYPKHINDVADAVKWVFDNIDKYGGDKNKIALLGHSAGAQMISLLATSPEFLPKRGLKNTDIRGVISADTEGYDVYGMGNAGAKIYQRVFGENPEVWKDASPIFQIQPGKTYPPFLIVMRGKPYRIEMANQFADKLKAAGTSVQLISGEPYSHFKVNNIIGSKKDTIVTPKIVAFLKTVLQ